MHASYEELRIFPFLPAPEARMKVDNIEIRAKPSFPSSYGLVAAIARIRAIPKQYFQHFS